MAKKPEPKEGISVSVRLSKELLAYIDARAAQENRSRSNLIETMLKQAAKN
jgi:metal-responsive CopG/Arc/MetJ family transcriptional regulator